MVTIETPNVVLGVNFGASFSSVAVINKEGLPDVIADEDGSRQIANAVSFAGEEEYIGIPGRKQLVRNNVNTILRFRDLLGKSYDECKSFKAPFNSAPLIDHQGQPAYRVVVNGQETVLTVSDIVVKFLRTLFNSATDFLGKKIDSCVFAVPADFSQAQSDALQKASAQAGVKTSHLIPDVAAAAVAYGWTAAPSSKFYGIDRNLLFLDVGASSTTATVVAARQGLLVPLSTVRDTSLGGEAFDDRLVEFFSKEFTKKTKVALDKSNHRAMMKLLLEVEATKRTLSVSTSANCAVESLAEGMDYAGVVNRTRLDLISSKVYQSITDKALEAVKNAGLDPVEIHEVVLIGGSSKLPTLSSRLSDLFPSHTSITSELDPDEVIAKGCVLQAGLLTKTSSAQLSPQEWQSVATSTSVLSKPIGLLLGTDKETGRFAPLLYENSPLPARKTIEVQVPEGDKEASVVLSLWEGKHEIKVEEPVKKTNGKKASKDSEDEDSEDEEPTRTPIVKADKQLVDLELKVDATIKGEGKRAATRSVKITLIVGKDGKGQVTAQQSKKGAEVFSAEF